MGMVSYRGLIYHISHFILLLTPPPPPPPHPQQVAISPHFIADILSINEVAEATEKLLAIILQSMRQPYTQTLK